MMQEVGVSVNFRWKNRTCHGGTRHPGFSLLFLSCCSWYDAYFHARL